MVDQNSLFNKNTRVIAFDDSPFSRRDKHTSIVGVIMRKDLYIESLKTRDVIRAIGRGFSPQRAFRLFDTGTYLEVIDLKDFTVKGNIPEPLRIADLIAGAL